MRHLISVNITNSFLWQNTFPSQKKCHFLHQIFHLQSVREIVGKKRQWSVLKWNFQLPNLLHWQRLLTYVSEEGHHSKHVSNACRSDTCWSPFNARGQYMSDTCWLLPSYTTRQMIGDRKKAPLKLNGTLCHLAQTLVIKRPDTNIPYTVWPNSWPHLSLAKISPIGEHLEPVQVTNDQWIICTAGVLTTLKVPGKHCQQL